MTDSWIFTFGGGHVHPTTGESLSRRFVRIPGDHEQARAKMLAMFGIKWSHQYATEAEAGVDRYYLRELPTSEWPPLRDERELTVGELDIDDMVGNMHFRVGAAWALLGGTRDGTPRERIDRAIELAPKLLELAPFLKALGRLAQENPGRARQLWAEALGEPGPFGMGAPGMPKTKVEP